MTNMNSNRRSFLSSASGALAAVFALLFGKPETQASTIKMPPKMGMGPCTETLSLSIFVPPGTGYINWVRCCDRMPVVDKYDDFGDLCSGRLLTLRADGSMSMGQYTDYTPKGIHLKCWETDVIYVSYEPPVVAWADVSEPESPVIYPDDSPYKSLCPQSLGWIPDWNSLDNCVAPIGTELLVQFENGSTMPAILRAVVLRGNEGVLDYDWETLDGAQIMNRVQLWAEFKGESLRLPAGKVFTSGQLQVVEA